ncbi:MAG: DNA starvation/stationary phase protection protein [Rhodospirillales bacterium]|nr:DNA starvation/stationary phase protection protein [Rhodospirillales bacterium]
MTQAPQTNTANSRRVVAGKLGTVLADTYLLMLKTQGYHWNVTGPRFHSLHAMFGEQYNALFLAADEIAERIRALGHKAPGTYAAFAKMSGLHEDQGLDEADDMLMELARDHTALAQSALAAKQAAQAVDDEVTADMMIGRMTEHDKTAWMLNASVAR